MVQCNHLAGAKSIYWFSYINLLNVTVKLNYNYNYMFGCGSLKKILPYPNNCHFYEFVTVDG